MRHLSHTPPVSVPPQPLESSPPRCPSPPLLPVWMNVYFLFPWCWSPLLFNSLSVLVVRVGAVCLPTPPSWFSRCYFYLFLSQRVMANLSKTLSIMLLMNIESVSTLGLLINNMILSISASVSLNTRCGLWSHRVCGSSYFQIKPSHVTEQLIQFIVPAPHLVGSSCKILHLVCNGGCWELPCLVSEAVSPHG